ncbi:MAG: hypothetical protein CM15mP117_20450 [Alphaproteobacteria bacterium]|nr:MAG: hypothetical protein CM15mP117_20450 [Alphaproteobacteria bacterium]
MFGLKLKSMVFRELAAFGLQFGHGLGLAFMNGAHNIAAVVPKNPWKLKLEWFLAETYCPATDGISAARIEEEVVVTDKGVSSKKPLSS